MLVDFQAHWTPPAYFEALLGRSDYPRAERRDGGFYVEFRPTEARFLPSRFVDLEEQIADMDAHGVDVMVSSPTHSDVSGLPRDEAVASVTLMNEGTAAAQSAHPERFVGLAVLPMEHPDAAVEIVGEAVGNLDLRGFCIHSNIGGNSIVNDGTKRVFAAIAEAGVPLFLHPTNSMLADKGLADAIERGMSWMCDTSAAALSLIYDGVLDEHPELEVVHPHAGGVIPFIVSRIDYMEQHSMSDVDPSRRELPVDGYLRRNFYTDSVNDVPGALELAAELYGPGRLLFATDYPFQPRSMTFDRVNGMADRSLLDASGPTTLRLPGRQAV